LERCDYIEPLLGAYQDGELPPAQAAVVQEHLSKCEICSEALLDFAVLGHQLREAIVVPSLAGFTEAVINCLPESSHTPGALSRLLEGLRQRWIPAMALLSSATAAAALAVVFLAPARAPVRNVVVAQASAPIAPAAQPSEIAEVDDGFNRDETFISRLETKDPSVAVWSEPNNKTTVIWLPDENSGDY
jgi:anti-sigma factor RsiW